MTVQGLTLLNDPKRLQEIIRSFPYDERDYPLLPYFTTEGYRAGKFTWRAVVGDRGMAKLVSNMNASPHLVQPIGVKELQASPMWMEEMHHFEPDEISLLKMYDQAIDADPASAEAKLAEILAQLRTRQIERKHWALVSMLESGAITYNSDGVIINVSYGLSALTAPSTKWSDAASTPLADIHNAIIQFTESAGYAPDALFYNPKLFPTYVWKTTEWKDLVKASPSMADAVRRGATQNMQLADIPVTWYPVSGQYQSDAGSVVDRWNPKKITLARLNRVGRRDLMWGTVLCEKNDYQAAPNAWSYGGTEAMKGRYVMHAFDNGLPIVKDQARIQTWQVVD